MSDPTLTRSFVDIRYSSSDGYHMSVGFAGGATAPVDAGEALLSAIDELARIASLFGLETEVKQRTDAACKRVAEWRAER